MVLLKVKKIQSSNFEVKDGEEQRGNVNINDRSFSMNIWNVDLSFEEIKTKVQTFIDSLEVEEVEV